MSAPHPHLCRHRAGPVRVADPSPAVVAALEALAARLSGPNAKAVVPVLFLTAGIFSARLLGGGPAG